MRRTSLAIIGLLICATIVALIVWTVFQFNSHENIATITVSAPPPPSVGPAASAPHPGNRIITGQVVDLNGNPINGARVYATTVLRNSRAAKTDSSGHFSIAADPSDSVPIVTMAKGYSPDFRRLSGPALTQPLRIQLSRGQSLIGRVVDAGGKPISAAGVRLLGWQHTYAYQLAIRTTTDSQGQFTIQDVPLDNAQYTIVAGGFKSNAPFLKPSSTVQTVTLQPLLTLSGAVVDQTTGKPVRQFSVRQGSQDTGGNYYFNFATPPEFFVNGHYHFQLADGGLPPDYTDILRVEAPGYLPAISDPLGGADSLTKNFSLQPAPDIVGHVLTPDVRPAAQIQVYLEFPGATARFQDWHMRFGSCPATITDARGAFRFAPDAGPFEVTAFSYQGFASVLRQRDAGDDLSLKLQPWGTISGRWQLPAGFQGAAVYMSEPSTPNEDSIGAHWIGSVPLSSDGRFTISGVPRFPGGDVLVEMWASTATRSEMRRVQLRLSPTGQAETIAVGGTTAVGRASYRNQQNQAVYGHGFIEFAPAVDHSANRWPVTPGILMYECGVNDDGRFELHDIPAGDYDYDSQILRPDNSFTSNTGHVRIPPSGDIGELPSSLPPHFSVGNPWPAEFGRTLDDKPIEIQSYAGKSVVIVLWNRGRAAQTAEPQLEQLASRFSAKSNLALISINTTDMSDCLGAPATLGGPTWLAGYLPLSQRAMLDGLKGQPALIIFIVGPDGKIIAANQSPSEAMQFLSHIN
jgi:hypothetical protein